LDFIRCTPDAHAQPILEILNDAILTSTALYDYEPRPLQSMAPWFAEKQRRGFPVLGACDAHGQLLGFATYGAFRPHPAYKYSVEHSVYVQREHRGQGIGRALLDQLITHAIAADVHVMVGVIDLENRASVALHERAGFEHSGTVRHAGFKFNRWLDVAFFQRTFATPAAPVDGNA
jgi:L-amino acid N-acyltransferase